MKGVPQFKSAARKVLLNEGIGSLRAYGREIGVLKPTEKKKEELIEEILRVLTEEIEPVGKSNRGAPIKNDYVNPRLVDHIAKLKRKFLRPDELTEELLESMKPLLYRGSQTDYFRKELAYKNTDMLVCESPLAEEFERERALRQDIYSGQLEKMNGNAWLLPIGPDEKTEKVLVPQEIIDKYDLREGDVVSCHAYPGENAIVSFDVLTINYTLVRDLKRIRFEEGTPCYPSESLRFTGPREPNPEVADKYFDWLIPIKKGQRGCIVSEPKAGKTTLIYQIANVAANHNRDVRVFVLLLDQAPEVAIQFKKGLTNADLMYTTYEDECKDHVFAAEFMLKRAKRYVEGGHHVLLLVDSLNALARAYNETEESSGGKILTGGIESKTLHYLKKYFNSARCFDNDGSLTLIGTATTATGNPADDFIASELSSVANLEINLSEDLAKKRIYPAIDLNKTRFSAGGMFGKEESSALTETIRREYLSTHSVAELYKLLAVSATQEEFVQKVTEALNQ